jgi:uncharacterized OB-fold protein
VDGSASKETTLGDAELVDRFAAWPVDPDNAAFYRGWLAHELRITRCGDCGCWHHPPRPMCPSCWSWDVVPTAVSGRGTIHLLTLLHQGPPVSGVDYSSGPYPVATVELDEQPALRITTTIIDGTPTQLAIGRRVELTWIERDGVPIPAFRPSRDQPA